jgi:lipid II:glycine glycyltransferase (peptidoglycan interpeptide bridge formation enzyme)
MIRCIPCNKIDKVLWDKTVSESKHPVLYAFSWYLDIVSPQWKALIYGNYEYIMPLPVKRKYGIPYIVQPHITQQLGIFSKHDITPEILKTFEKSLFSFFSVRYSSNIQFQTTKARIKQRVNYILPLQKSYEELYSNFSENCVRNIKKSQKNCIQVQLVSLDFFITHFKELSLFTIPEPIWQTIQTVLSQAQNSQSLYIYSAFFEHKVCALAAFITSNNSMYYLVPGANSVARKYGASYAIVNACIKERCLQYAKLDFEGSEIAGIAQFYASFGAIVQPYYYISKHSIPGIYSFLKK